MASISFSERFAYPGETALALASAALRAFVAWLLWSAVLAGKESVGGMGIGAIVAYYLVASSARTLDRSEGYAWEFAAEIRSGDFAKYMVRPVDPLRCFLAVSAGRSAYQACVLAAAALAALPFLGAASLPQALGLALALPVLLLGLLALALLNFMTSILAFVFQDITPFHMVKTDAIEFLSGALVPLAMMPAWAREILAWTPFTALASLPARLWAGQGLDEVPRALAVLAAWCLALYLAARASLAALTADREGAGS